MDREMEILHSAMAQPPVDIVGVIKRLGIEYREKPMPDGESGRIDASDGQYTITVNSREGTQRRRFTAAHELAHYLLHRDLLDGRGHLDRLFNGEQMNPAAPFSPAHEVQANRYAAELLAPAGKVTFDFHGLQGTDDEKIAVLAERYEISQVAMRIRLKSLGLID